MQKRTLGRMGLELTQLGFGAMELRDPKVRGNRGPLPDELYTSIRERVAAVSEGRQV